MKRKLHMKNSYYLPGLVLGLVLSTTALASESILFNNESLYPEGVSYDAQDKLFYVSSVARGEVWRVSQNGNNELFIKNDKFASTIGLQVDRKRNRLLVCIADPGVGKNTSKETKGKFAGLAIYDLTSKKQLAYYDLLPSDTNSSHFANDVTIDKNGNSYVTDSFSPDIYKVSLTGKITTFASDPRWSVPQGKFGLNGIVYHPDGFLIVSHYDSGKLYKVSIQDKPEVKEIKLAQKKGWNITGLDGLLLFDHSTLIAVNNDPSGKENGNVVYRLLADEKWDNLVIDGMMPTKNTYPTTLTSKNEKVFVLHAKLLQLFTGNKSPETNYVIEKVSFSDLKQK